MEEPGKKFRLFIDTLAATLAAKNATMVIRRSHRRRSRRMCPRKNRCGFG